VKFVNEFPEDSIRTKFPILTVVSWKYNGEENNGMPLKDVNKKMIVLEDALEDAMDSSGLYQHAYSRTGNNLKEFVYYCTKQDEFMDILNKSLVNHEKYPINIDFYEDEQWNEFRQLLDDFINKDWNDCQQWLYPIKASERTDCAEHPDCPPNLWFGFLN